MSIKELKAQAAQHESEAQKIIEERKRLASAITSTEAEIEGLQAACEQAQRLYARASVADPGGPKEEVGRQALLNSQDALKQRQERLEALQHAHAESARDLRERRPLEQAGNLKAHIWLAVAADELKALPDVQSILSRAFSAANNAGGAAPGGWPDFLGRVFKPPTIQDMQTFRTDLARQHGIPS